jgi:hypothetical protein
MEALQPLRSRLRDDPVRDGNRAKQTNHRMTARMIADTLHLHPTTVYTHSALFWPGYAQDS